MFLAMFPVSIGLHRNSEPDSDQNLARKTRKNWFLVFSDDGNRFGHMREVRSQNLSFLRCALKKNVFLARLGLRGHRLLGRLINKDFVTPSLPPPLSEDLDLYI